MRIKGIVAALISTTLLFGGLTGIAAAHTFTDRTRLTLHVNDRHVDRGDDVVFSGRLRARHKKCRSHQVVELYRNGRLIATTTTNSGGHYRFRRQIFRTGTYRVKFAGFVGGTHPHSHTCKRSSSPRVKVHVRR